MPRNPLFSTSAQDKNCALWLAAHAIVEDTGLSLGTAAQKEALVKLVALNRQQLKKIQVLVDKAKPEYKRFAIALKSAGEIESFNNFIAAGAKETGSSSLIAAASAGNPYKILLKADTVLKRAIKDRRRELHLATGPDDLMLKLLGIGSAEAGFFRKAANLGCSIGIFVVTLGYGTDFNYHACGQDRPD